MNKWRRRPRPSWLRYERQMSSRALNYRSLGINSFNPEHLAEIVNMLDGGKITDDAAVK
jgi:hypothetical protein